MTIQPVGNQSVFSKAVTPSPLASDYMSSQHRSDVRDVFSCCTFCNRRGESVMEGADHPGVSFDTCTHFSSCRGLRLQMQRRIFLPLQMFTTVNISGMLA